MAEMKFDTFEETVKEVAHDLGRDEDDLRALFSAYLARHPRDAPLALKPEDEAACYCLYRLVKLKGACRMGRRSRELWRGRALEMGYEAP